ncbi:probable E3 ubiquitin-protein ligase ARI8 [Papaver somniferum]|uniref:probable E3 ubiquitin-protein ligase ARI8 n=1 Tax=Papaver somniferum TaxID=3469 RepID=UPI000E700692|nr:probable E3 ubiquitin-protein ligase ARI8 [Papaver somniferum]
MYSDDDIYDDGMGYSDFNDEDYSPDDDTKEVPQKNCTIINTDVIRQKQEKDISSISNLLVVSRVSAVILLLGYNWRVEKLKDEWFADEQKVRKAVGLFPEKPIINGIENIRQQKLTCGICFEAYHHYEMYDVAAGAACGHLFCMSCWKGYIGTSVNNGPGCLKLRCPEPSCNAAVGQDMINAFACEEGKLKYSTYLLRSYIEDNKEFKWCPAPDCGLAIKFENGSDSCDVTCECTYSFCWNCSKEAHRPVDCGTMEKWILKSNDESENVRWILVHSKPCPNCKRPIEKDVGCNHMTCSICGFEFCWICLVSINNHSCNRFKGDKGDRADDNLERDTARNHLAKYSHYYERWVSNHRSLDHAVESMKNMEIYRQLEELRFILCLDDEKELKFIKDAWEKIIECRRVLKWSYAFGYYLPEHEHGKIQLFEYLQGEAESGLESLHRFVEEKLQVFLGLDFDAPLENFKKIREALEKKTTVTGYHFEKLVSAFKDGLSEVHSQGAGSSNKERAAYECGGEGQKYAGTTSLNYYSSEYSDDDYH